MIVHILDNNLEIPVLSEVEHPVEDDINEFLEKHIIRVLNDGSLRPARFNEGDNRVKDICVSYNLNTFIDDTKELSEMLFNLIKSYPDIPPADIVFSIFLYEGRNYLGIFKLNYRTSYIHNVDQVDEKVVNSIIKQRTSLPNENQKVDECVLIDLTTLDINLLEKEYDINGEKIYYLSRLFLKCSSKRSEKEKVKILTKTTKKFLENNYEGDYEKVGEAKKAVAESLKTKEEIDVEEVASSIFRNNVEMKKEYIETMEKEGLEDKSFKVNEKIQRRNFRKQKIVTDTGIEINVPIEFFNDKDRIEFINNVDGTVSILLKQIGNIKNK
nr:nucleoid-associated protein [Anaeromonas frigoriresistens]